MPALERVLLINLWIRQLGGHCWLLRMEFANGVLMMKWSPWSVTQSPLLPFLLFYSSLATPLLLFFFIFCFPVSLPWSLFYSSFFHGGNQHSHPETLLPQAPALSETLLFLLLNAVSLAPLFISLLPVLSPTTHLMVVPHKIPLYFFWSSKHIWIWPQICILQAV